jgi:hypothetical protein
MQDLAWIEEYLNGVADHLKPHGKASNPPMRP